MRVIFHSCTSETIKQDLDIKNEFPDEIRRKGNRSNEQAEQF
jgi:hypothetical protein